MYGYDFELGPIRPPSEADSILLRVTRNCPWNKCDFCGVYKGEKFSLREVDEIKRDIDAMKRAGITGSSAFLQDANSIILKPDKLAEVLVYFRQQFPTVKRVTSYGRADTLSRISPENLKMLKEAGLDRIHSGYETGSDRILKSINKGCTKQQEIEGGLKVREAGLELSMYFMPGVGGKEYSEENSEETADVINRVNPDFVRLRTFVAKPGTPMGDRVTDNSFVPCTDEEKVYEIRDMIKKLEGCTGTLVSDHIVNLLERVEGHMTLDRDRMLGAVSEFESLEPLNKRRFQLARRMGFVRSPRDVFRLPDNVLLQITKIAGKEYTPEEWEELMNYFLEKYI
ncbi:MAG: radical SAM protein [Bacillota bacterium]|nr:radical SAM protein [Bacillota bacterium]